MPYADYAFYTDIYGGSTVPAERWGGVALRADAMLDEFTFGRLRRCGLGGAGAVRTDAVGAAGTLGATGIDTVPSAKTATGDSQPSDTPPYEVRMACCALADVLYAQLAQAAARTPGVASEDIEGLRVAYESSEAQAARARIERCEALEAFLPRWHPLRYAGV